MSWNGMFWINFGRKHRETPKKNFSGIAHRIISKKKKMEENTSCETQKRIRKERFFENCKIFLGKIELKHLSSLSLNYLWFQYTFITQSASAFDLKRIGEIAYGRVHILCTCHRLTETFLRYVFFLPFFVQST